MMKVRWGVEEPALRARIRRGGWSRRKVWAERAAQARAAAIEASTAEPRPTAFEPLTLDAPAAVEVAEAALLEALKALRRGDARQASALIKAGDAVGTFAEFTANLQSRRAQDRETGG